jgi:hypothetical protein
MDNNQTLSQGAHASAFSMRNRDSLRIRFVLMILLLMLSVASLQSKVPAQTADQALHDNKSVLTSLKPTNCDECERALVQCLAGGGGVFCDIQYDICIENCD